MKFKKQCPLGKMISIRLVELDKTKKWLSETTGIAACMITKYCIGESIPTIKSADKLSKALDISVDEIINVITEMERVS